MKMVQVVFVCMFVIACRNQAGRRAIVDADVSATREVPKVSEKVAIEIATKHALSVVPDLVNGTVARAKLRPDGWIVVFVDPAINTKGMKGGDLEVLVDKNAGGVLRLLVHQ